MIESFEKTKVAGSIAAGALDEVNNIIKPGISTLEIDKLCYQFINDHKAFSAPLYYRGYPYSCCTSANHVVCHGIPSEKILKNGDIINVDVTAVKDGWHGDTSRMFMVGECSVKAKKLIKITYEAMMNAIKTIKANVKIGQIGFTIQKIVEAEGFSVVRDFCGHGIGRNFHESPNVLHYGEKNSGLELKAGMIFTVEPMINAGNFETKTLKDGWTAVTKDKSLSAQFEHTVGVTEEGYEIFTLSKKGLNFPPNIE
jgi:methionyl aminopeptidase